jgi:hypothetical protein
LALWAFIGQLYWHLVGWQKWVISAWFQGIFMIGMAFAYKWGRGRFSSDRQLFNPRRSRIMAFTEQELFEQEQAVSRLLDEFLRLNNQFDTILKAQGVTEEFLKDADADNPPPELKAQLETAKAAAKRAGEERRGQAEREAEAPAGRAASAYRPGAIRL